ncbi:d-aminoacyl-tRNA deacylase 1 [Trichonephila inaurata madagascariensis]|uniref:D-aminoacyl-tRNA deacylase n=1 Tax=Trichonephila inaurata madagascariensis TaxID=2747483 RepID=A0A8X7CFJ2_9ARAC|nr:d-aminoacyl-tRNA deacylase 1 [Trichonephila inaurata madagascariensis]
MRVVIQRCSKASVLVGDEVISSIGRGICVLVGISKNDTKKDMDFMVRKLVNIRLFDDENGKRWCHSIKDKGYEVLLVSQFTLLGTLKGNKPDFRTAMGPEASAQFYSDFVSAVKQAYCEERVKDGKFGAYMQVCIQNDGPVTINLESPVKSVVNLQAREPVQNSEDE